MTLLRMREPEREAPADFFLPEYWLWERARRAGVSIAHVLGPEYAASVHGLLDKQQAGDLAYRLGGRAVRPTQDVVLLGPTGRPIVIVGAGVTEAAELEETALAAYEKQVAKQAAGTPLVDFDALRERGGYVPRAQTDTAIREALHDRIKRHKANPVTDPARVPSNRRARGQSFVATQQGD